MLDRPFSGSAAVARGLVTPNRLRGPHFHRLFPDVYVANPGTPELRTWSRAAYLLVEHRGGVLAGYSAALLLGADRAPPGAPAELIVPGGHRRYPNVVAHRGEVPQHERRRVDGGVVTTPERTAWDLSRQPELTEAVVALDALGRLGGFDLERLRHRRLSPPGARGSRRFDRAIALADPRAESPMETRLRLLLVRAGLPPPSVRHRLVDEHGFVVARFDLAYPEELLAVEYDGRGHRRREFSADDRWRDTVTGDHGWHTMRFGPDDVLLSRRRTAELVRNQLTLRAGAAARLRRPA